MEESMVFAGRKREGGMPEERGCWMWRHFSLRLAMAEVPEQEDEVERGISFPLVIYIQIEVFNGRSQIIRR